MAIKISGTTVIDDSRNLVSVGVATVGSGDSAVILNGDSGITNIGSGVTINGNTGDMNISGILTVGQLNVPIEVSYFSPAIGATGVSINTNIILTFNQTVGIGTTGSVEIKVGSATTGTLIETLYPSSSGIALTSGGTKLSIDPTSSLPSVDTIYPIMSSGFVTANGSDFTGINTVGSATTYSFTTGPVTLGDAYEGGYLICQSGGTRWVVAPASTEVSRNWYSRSDAVTTANANAACGNWFVPSCGQLQNPGATCVTYWDSYSPNYWSDTQRDNARAWSVSLPHGGAGFAHKNGARYVRAFRCVTY